MIGKRIWWVVFLAIPIFIACDTAREIKYEVTGSTSSASVTLSGKDETTIQYSGISIPWKYEFKAEAGEFLYISAQNDQKYGSVTVNIYVDGDKFKSATSSGAYVIATASGSCP